MTTSENSRKYDPKEPINNSLYMRFGDSPSELKRKSEQISRLKYYALYHCKYLPFLVAFLFFIEANADCNVIYGETAPINYKRIPSYSEIYKSTAVTLLFKATCWFYLVVDSLQIVFSLSLAATISKGQELGEGFHFIYYVVCFCNLGAVMFAVIFGVFMNGPLDVCKGDYLQNPE